MLQIYVPTQELWSNETETFINVQGTVLKLEHSLVSISKWEAKWKKPFLESKDITENEWRDYVRCMNISNKEIDPSVYLGLTPANLAMVRAYINDPMSATVIKSQQTKGNKHGQFVTSELIYYWMIEAKIPFECEKWHFNRLMMLLQVCGEKSKPAKKMSRRDLAKSRSALNARRRAALGTSG